MVVWLQVDAGRVQTFRFEARGCLVAIASGSLLGEQVEGRMVDEVRQWLARLPLLLTGPTPDELTALEPLGSVRDFPARRACVELAWKALAQALG